MRIRPTRIRRKEEEADFISVVNTNEDPPNAHQAQEEEEEEEEVFTREYLGGSAQHACHMSRTSGPIPLSWSSLVEGYPGIFWMSNAAPSQ